MFLKFKAFLVVNLLVATALAEENFDVLSIENVPFPSSDHIPATINSPSFSKEIPEFTVCFRFLITFYNDAWLNLIRALYKRDMLPWNHRYFGEFLDFNNGFEYQGYQFLLTYLYRNIPDGGVGGKRHPQFMGGYLPQKVTTGKWFHSCTAYSSIQHKNHGYYNGMKVYSFNYSDPLEGPMPADTFHYMVLGVNMRGFITDLQIYDTFFNEQEMATWTAGCQQLYGKIFSWDGNKVNLTMATDSPLNVTIIKRPKSEICPEPKKKQEKQAPSRVGGKSTKLRYRPNFTEENPSFVGKTIEIISDPFAKSPLEAKDRCTRLAGEILTVPQNDEEEKLLAKVQRDFMMKKTGNNLTFITENWKIAALWVGGESAAMAEVYPDLKNKLSSGHLTYPENGYVDFYHPITGALIKPKIPMLVPVHHVLYSPLKLCIVCFSPFEKPAKDHPWFHSSMPMCHVETCTVTRACNFACVFDSSPTLSLRGLCKESVMDIQYKLADHDTMDLELNRYPDLEKWGDSTRSYVGPKGWILSRYPDDKLWRLKHKSYEDLTLTMLDMDALPVGRHQWRVENNICNQGETNIETLLLSACKEDQFTCDDGKCLSITQRCNNIEVNMNNRSDLISIFEFCNRTVMM